MSSGSDSHSPYDARTVANFILFYHFQKPEPVTQLRLYKLLYFAHGWHLVERQKPLVWNDFEAWKNGPVVKVVRDNFASFKDYPIDTFAKAFDFRRGQLIEMPHRLDASAELFVGAVIEGYKRYTAGQLSMLTHTKGSAWE